MRDRLTDDSEERSFSRWLPQAPGFSEGELPGCPGNLGILADVGPLASQQGSKVTGRLSQLTHADQDMGPARRFPFRPLQELNQFPGGVDLDR